MVFFFSVLVCCFSSISFADPLVQDPNFTYLSTRQGLSQDTVNDILVDRTGFVWIATEGGLDRWDGYRYDHIAGPDQVFTNASITKLFMDSHGNLWISTYSSGIFRYNLNTNTIQNVLSAPFKYEPEWIQSAASFQEEDSGNVIIAIDQKVYRYNVRDNTATVIFELPDAMIKEGNYIRMALVVDETMLLATERALLAVNFRDPESQPEAVDYLGGSLPNRDKRDSKYLFIDEKRNFFVGTVEGLYVTPLDNLLASLKKPGSTARFKEVVPYRNIWEITQGAGNNLWLGTDIGLMSLKQNEQGQWESAHVLEPNNGKDELAKKDIKAVTVDKTNNLWLGSSYGGALYWSANSLSIFTVQNNYRRQDDVLSNNTIWSIYQSDPQTLWLGTDNGLTKYRQDSNTSELFLMSSGVKAARTDTTIEKVFKGSGNTLILQTLDGLRLFDIKTSKTQVLPVNDIQQQSELEKWTGAAAMDSKGRLFFIGDKSFYRYDTSSQELIELNFDEPTVNVPFSYGFIAAPDFYNGSVFLSMLDGLWLVDEDTFKLTLVYRYPPEQRNNAVAVTSLVVDRERNILWLGFPRFGLLGLDATTFELKHHFHKDNLLSTNIVYSLQQDKQGFLWFSSHSGLHRFSPDTKQVSNFIYGQDLEVSEFNEDAVLELDDGRLAYGSTNGLIIFDPEKIAAEADRNRFTPTMAISSVELDSRKLNTPMINLSGKHFELQHDDFGVSIHFSSLFMSQYHDEVYRYNLSRGNDIISEAKTKDNNVIFAFLAPGTYRFEVSPAVQQFDYTVMPAAITFTIPYPPMRSPLAYSIYVGAILLTLLLYFYHRQRQLNRLHQAQHQVRLFGDAFKQTRDWVIIFDANMVPVAANPACKHVFGIEPDQHLDRQLNRLYQRFPKLQRQLSGRLSNLRAGEFWKNEDVIEGADGRRYDVLVDITAITEDKNSAKVDHYLVVISDISEQKNAERKLLKIANYDSLTGLVNRSLLLDRLEHAIANASHHNTKVAVLFVDLDRFKGINDSLGHDYGDKLLRIIGSRMANLASSNDTVARLGGDEFVLVMEEVENSDALSSFVGRLIEAVETPVALGNEVLRVSCSVGVSFYPDDASVPAELLKQADVAMYTAKKDTLNGFTYYTSEMNERAKKRLHLENQVKTAFQEDCFHNHYQPIVNVKTGRMEGVELLLRCKLNDETLFPNDFIPILEQLRYIIEVTRVALNKAVEDLTQWYQKGYRGYVSVNLSALHFKTEFDVDGILSQLTEASLPISALRFEITEGVLMDDTDNALYQIQRFIDAGFVLALDDFGTGYSSLSYLKKFPLQVLKIDKSFVDDLQPGHHSDALVLTTIRLAASLNMVSVAEGVETYAQAKYLAQKGCYCQQGYYYSKPIEADRILSLLDKKWPVLAVTDVKNL
ncbi:EAL domain-containing protein [Alteromonas pelagimontana]|uniref:EAL domain-containing protein n=2 Tax=Alteromonas pelagimontana TaxID=1858656 RepID=A0A6N3IVN6_9ALTE|nr:EAL domain-containing protein [Alteromonas pelagimontana]